MVAVGTGVDPVLVDCVVLMLVDRPDPTLVDQGVPDSVNGLDSIGYL